MVNPTAGLGASAHLGRRLAGGAGAGSSPDLEVVLVAAESFTELRGKAADVLARCRACGEPYDATLLRAYNMTRADEYRVTLNEVAELMAGLPGAPSRRTIYNWAESGKLPTEGEGAARTCKPSDAVYLLERGRVDAAA